MKDNIELYNYEKKNKMKQEFKESKSKKAEFQRLKEELQIKNKKTDEELEDLIDLI